MHPNSTAIPLELILLIAHFAAVREDNSVLTLAKTCRHLYRPCQKLLFSHVFIGHSETCRLLLEALEFRNSLAGYIKELRISQEAIDYWVLTDGHLPKLLAHTTAVEHFSLENAQEFSHDEEYAHHIGIEPLCYWRYLSESTQDAFMQMFSLPSLRAITITQLWDIPVDFFSTFGHLECLTLVDVDFEEEEDFDIAAIVSRPASVQTLDLSLADECDQLNELISHPGSYFAKITSLVVRTHCVSADDAIAGVTAKIMEAAARSIRNIRWIEERDASFISQYDISFGMLRRLEHLTFFFDITIVPDTEEEEQCHDYLTGLLEALKPPSVVAHMKHLKIIINQARDNGFIFRMGLFREWKQLDKLVAAGNVQVEIILDTNDLAFSRMGDVLWKQMLATQMPILNARGQVLARVAYDEKHDDKYMYILGWP